MAQASDAEELCAAGFDAVWEAGFRSGDFSPAETLFASAGEFARTHNGVAFETTVLDGLGMLAHFRHIVTMLSGEIVVDDDVAAEEALFQKALSLHQQSGDRAKSALSLFGIGLAHQVWRRDWKAAMPYFLDALEIVKHHGDVDLYTQSEVHRHLGFCYNVEMSDPMTALEYLEISLNLRYKLGDRRRILSGLHALAEAELDAGHRERAMEPLEEAVSQARSAGYMEARIADMEQTLEWAKSIKELIERGTDIRREAFLMACYRRYLDGVDDLGIAIEVNEPSLGEDDRREINALDGVGLLCFRAFASLNLVCCQLEALMFSLTAEQ